MKRLEYCVKLLPHPKYYKRQVGGCGKKKIKRKKRKIRKERKKKKKKKEKSGIMIK